MSDSPGQMNHSEPGDADAPEASLAPPEGKQPPPADRQHRDTTIEERLWSGRTDWRHHIGLILVLGLIDFIAWIVALKSAAAFGAACTWGFVVTVATALIALIWIGRSMLTHRYELTTQRLFIDRGILNQTRDQTELIRVDDVRIHKRLVDRIVGTGTVEVMSTDATDQSLLIKGVRDPDAIAEHIRSRMRALRSKSLFIESL